MHDFDEYKLKWTEHTKFANLGKPFVIINILHVCSQNNTSLEHLKRYIILHTETKKHYWSSFDP